MNRKSILMVGFLAIVATTNIMNVSSSFAADIHQMGAAEGPAAM